MDYSPRVSSVHGISQARILGWPCPHPGHLPNPGIEPVSFMSLALAGGFYPLSMCEIFVSPIMINVFFLSEKKKKKPQNAVLPLIGKRNTEYLLRNC